MPFKPFTLADYQDTLRTALQSHYEFITFGNITTSPTTKRCLLRHDVDNELYNCLDMARLEASLGISSTYFVMLRSTSYNIFCIEARQVINEILSLGHDIGLHFMGEQHAKSSWPLLARSITSEIRILEKELGTKIHAFSFHQPSERLLKKNLNVPSVINTYNKKQMADFFYISDTNMTWRHGHPKIIFKAHTWQNLQLLIHPMWWTKKTLSLKNKWLTVLKTNNDTIKKHWKIRENSLKNIVF